MERRGLTMCPHGSSDTVRDTEDDTHDRKSFQDGRDESERY